MSHTVQIVDYKQLSNGQFAVQTRCCGAERHTSWHTMDASVLIDDAQREASLNEHCAIMATHHEAVLQAEKHLAALVGKENKV